MSVCIESNWFDDLLHESQSISDGRSFIGLDNYHTVRPLTPVGIEKVIYSRDRLDKVSSVVAVRCLNIMVHEIIDVDGMGWDDRYNVGKKSLLPR